MQDPLNVRTLESDVDESFSDDDHMTQDHAQIDPSFSFSLGPLPLPSTTWSFSTSSQALAAKANLKASAKTSIDHKISQKVKSLSQDITGTASELLASSHHSINESDSESTSAQLLPPSVDSDDEQDTVRDKKKAEFFDSTEMLDPQEGIDSFHLLQISRPVLKSITSLGYIKPTEIQSRAIPLALQGRDICGSAVTGSGKTAAFIIPILERLLFRPKTQACTRVLVLVPTRELGVQCQSVAENLSKFTDISTCLCVGGLSTKLQEAELKQRPDIVIATPGRLIDHIHNSATFSLDTVEILVIDEADRILEDGFTAELNEIIKHTPKTRQTMLFSATMTDNVDDLIKLSMTRPVRLFVDRNTSLAGRLVQEFVRVRSNKEESRPALLAALCSRTYTSETIIFFRSKVAAHHMKIVFGLLGLKAAELHGNLTQLQRLEAIEQFREKKVSFLLATDLASRGLDISGVRTVINYDMPNNYTVYVHRVGRTARGERGGRAVSLVGEADRAILKMAIKNTKDAVKNRVVPADVIKKYEGLIAKLADAVKEIYAQEKDEKAFTETEIELKRAENLLVHRDEINSRPARTWFQSGKERADAKTPAMNTNSSDVKNANGKRSSTDKDEFKEPKARPATSGLSRKKRRLRESRESDSKDQIIQSKAARIAKSATRKSRLSKFPASKTSGKQFHSKKGSMFDGEMRSKRNGKKKR